jgi:polyhydroxyalkanoate synthesis regulator phasin
MFVIRKSEKQGDLHRLLDIEPQFVSIVTAGANRQRKFQVVKVDKSANQDDAGANRGSDVNGGHADDEVVDNSKWLSDAQNEIDGLIFEASIFSTTHSDDASGTAVGKASIDEGQSAPSVDSLLEKNAELVGAMKKRDERIEKMTSEIEKMASEIEKLNTDVEKLRRERGKLQAQVARLRGSVGGSTSLITGNIAAKTGNDEEGEMPWASGGDMAAKAERLGI